MRKNNNIIAINGQTYDTKTGSLVTPAGSPINRAPAKRASGHSPEPTRTLMRHAVKKPNPSLKRQHKVQGRAAVAPQSLNSVVISPPVGQLDEKRLRHAKQIPRSRMISHFPSLTAAGTPPSPRESVISLPRRPANHATGRTPISSTRQPKPTSATADLFNDAIERATSHLQPPPPKSRRSRLKRNAGMGAAVGLSVVLLGLIVAQNATGVRLQMASAKAGFDVSLPGYRPAGFALGQLNYSSGAVAAQFSSPTGNRHYTITQKQSPWDSQALLNNFVAADYTGYQTISANGLVIYLYGNHDATWVNDGVWYVVQSDGSLSDQQLIALAASL